MPVVSGLEAARAALRAGASELESPAYAACHAGVNYWHHLIQIVRAEFPGDWHFLLCCGEDPAIAHEALRLGFKRIRLQANEGMLAELHEIAAASDAQILRQPSPEKE